MESAGHQSEAWLEPSPALGAETPGGDVLTAHQVREWRERGGVLVDGVFPRDLLKRVREEAAPFFPEAGSAESERFTDFGSGGKLVFPARSAAVNEVTLHPRLLRALAQLLDVPVRELRLTQSDLWPKFGRRDGSGELDNQDQRIHVDYPNHTLTHPPRWDEPEAVELILYLSNVDECGGATAVVPREGPEDPAYPWPIVQTPGVGELDWVNDRTSAEAYLRERAPEIQRWRAEHLYPREQRARFGFGSLLLYRHDTWHRGTPLLPGTMRLAQNMTFKKAGSEWISVLHSGWAWAMYRPGRQMERLIANATVDQRCVLGFPAPGHAYWTRATLDAVGARYGPLGMDLRPYRDAMASRYSDASST